STGPSTSLQNKLPTSPFSFLTENAVPKILSPQARSTISTTALTPTSTGSSTGNSASCGSCSAANACASLSTKTAKPPHSKIETQKSKASFYSTPPSSSISSKTTTSSAGATPASAARRPSNPKSSSRRKSGSKNSPTLSTSGAACPRSIPPKSPPKPI